MYKNFLKRLFDFILAFVVFILAFPVFLCVVLLLFLANRGKVFFIQTRPGLNERLFNIIKFKTMNDRMDKQGNLLPDDVRLTLIGKWVRKLSLDELPQLLNVIKGEMSLIGPRPLLPEYLPLYNKEQKLRHSVKPGITGWAQVNGRNAIDWKTKFELDVWYVRNLSFLTDLKIVLITLKRIIRPKDISSETSVTMEKFTGN